MTTQSLMANTDLCLLEVDHLQIYMAEGWPAIQTLQKQGFNNGNRIIRRERQGTASTLFFFENTYLELIWIEDEIAFQNYATQTRMNLISRSYWQDTGACPFGIGLRYKTNILTDLDNSFINPFGTEWDSPETVNFSTENLGRLEEPICFTIPNAIALTTWLDHSQETHQQLMVHPLGIKKLTGVQISINTHKASTNAVALLEENGIISIERGKAPLLELTFDDNAQKKVIDARPMLPIRVKY